MCSSLRFCLVFGNHLGFLRVEACISLLKKIFGVLELISIFIFNTFLLAIDQKTCTVLVNAPTGPNFPFFPHWLFWNSVRN